MDGAIMQWLDSYVTKVHITLKSPILVSSVIILIHLFQNNLFFEKCGLFWTKTLLKNYSIFRIKVMRKICILRLSED